MIMSSNLCLQELPSLLLLLASRHVLVVLLGLWVRCEESVEDPKELVRLHVGRVFSEPYQRLSKLQQETWCMLTSRTDWAAVDGGFLYSALFNDLGMFCFCVHTLTGCYHDLVSTNKLYNKYQFENVIVFMVSFSFCFWSTGRLFRYLAFLMSNSVYIIHTI